MRIDATRAASILLIVAACGGGTATPPPQVPAIELRGMQSELTTVTAERLARDALEPEVLASLLEDAGYRSGAERTYAGPGARFSLAITRVLSFEDPDGAETYLDWLRDHSSDLLGTADPLPPLDLPGSFVAVHLPGGCCPKAVPVYLSAWRRGSSVFSVKVSGRGADPDSVEDLAAALNSSAGGTPDA
jgi:hypothetical protein